MRNRNRRIDLGFPIDWIPIDYEYFSGNVGNRSLRSFPRHARCEGFPLRRGSTHTLALALVRLRADSTPAASTAAMADAVVDASLGREAPVDAYANYNKSTHRVALVGNWVEERALEADTGVFRYKVRADPPLPRVVLSPPP